MLPELLASLACDSRGTCDSMAQNELGRGEGMIDDIFGNTYQYIAARAGESDKHRGMPTRLVWARLGRAG